MKRNIFILSMAIAVIALGSCEEKVMEWKTPDGHNPVDYSEIPLSLSEKIANYDFIKAYAPSGLNVGIGVSEDLYLNDTKYKQVTDDNFHGITMGNAMKHSSVVRNNGELDFTTIDRILELIPSDMSVYGHTFIWHTQQKQNYLKTLISPQVIIDTDPSEKIENVVQNSDFESGNTSGWGAWSSAGATQNISEVGKGYNSDYAMELYNPEAGANYSAQAYYTLPEIQWEIGATYVYSLYVYSEEGNDNLQMQIQSRTSYSGGAYRSQNVPAKQWYYFEAEFEMTQDLADLAVTHLTIDFGAGAGTYYIDNVKFGKKVEDKMINVLGDDSHFDNGSIGAWGGWGNNSTRDISAKGEGYMSDYCMVMVNPVDADSWSAQTAYTLPTPLEVGKTYMYSAMVKATVVNTDFTFQVQNSTTYDGEGYVSGETVANTWIPIEGEFVCTKEGLNRLCINFGKAAGTYYVDNIKFGEKRETASTNSLRSGGITYIYKTPEEKKEALLGAMESWIKGMLEHTGDRVQAWDVINEPIADNNQWRGIDGNFAGEDSEPVENNGLELNWGEDRFYWGYYIGKEYAVKAFEYARKYAPAGTKLFVNDYNLESNPQKLTALIDFVNYIETNGQPVDGIGTQMHISADTTASFKANIDQMFTALANTGKLVRVTELDVRLGTATPSAEQLEVQALTYQYVVESYFKHVPESQRSAITVWGLTDDAREHEFWLPNESPNLFDRDLKRKHAYKGFCDGLAGRDISEDFSGDDYVKIYFEE